MYLVENEPRICDKVLICNKAKIPRPLVGDVVILSVRNVVFAVVVTYYGIFPDLDACKTRKVRYFGKSLRKPGIVRNFLAIRKSEISSCDIFGLFLGKFFETALDSIDLQ